MTYSRLRLHNQKLPRATVSRLRLLSVPTQATSHVHRPLSTQAKMRSRQLQVVTSRPAGAQPTPARHERTFTRPACKQAHNTEELDSGSVSTVLSTSFLTFVTRSA